MMLRKKEPDAERPYKVPWGNVIPIWPLSALSPHFSSPRHPHHRGTDRLRAWFVIGVIYYLLSAGKCRDQAPVKRSFGLIDIRLYKTWENSLQGGAY
jgi:hypothetical protein